MYSIERNWPGKGKSVIIRNSFADQSSLPVLKVQSCASACHLQRVSYYQSPFSFSYPGSSYRVRGSDWSAGLVGACTGSGSLS